MKDQLKKINEEYGCFTTIEEVEGKGEGKLKDYNISVKDCICVKGVESTAGSSILKGYAPPFNATVIEKVLNEGGKVIGKTAQDEFGFGSFSLNVGKGFQIPLNPNDKERSCGGSSGGSGCITKLADFNHISLSESTGGSIACPASYCGVVGLCPTYGRVSRYGLIDFGNSLDKIGPMAKSVKECALALEVIAGHDNKDSTSINTPEEKYTEYIGKGVKGLRIGVLRDKEEEWSKEVKENFDKKVKELEDKGATVEEVSLPVTSKYGLSAYYIIALSESSTNLAKFCGIRYGNSLDLEGDFNSYFSKVRSEFFGEEVKRRIMLGTFARMSGFRDAYYIKASKIRTKIIREYKEMFNKYDVLVSPTMPNVPPKIEEVKKMKPIEHYMMDFLTVGPNIAGLPHINIPMEGELPTGFMVIGNHLQEGKIIQVGNEI